ncbi:MAG TPA: hypothetical protein VHU18_11865 [Rhizomicrobium sp.]|jgi:hypothetical protein|nr:hypothetical protein [Rhizomicrobium sp.]
MKHLSVAGALLILGSCPAGASNLPSNATFYTECLKSALQSQAVDRDGTFLRFACYGETAEWFYNALGRRDVDVQQKRIIPVTHSDSRRLWIRPQEERIAGVLPIPSNGAHVQSACVPEVSWTAES